MRYLIMREFENIQKDVQFLMQNVISRVSSTVDFLNQIWKPIAFALDLSPLRSQHKGCDIAKYFLIATNSREFMKN